MPFWRIAQIHHRGFLVGDWLTMGITESNYKKYLSSKQYYSLHPYNGRYSDWIDDKLTLKYILHGTELSEHMPDYYFLIRGDGVIHALMDCPFIKDTYSAEDIFDLLAAKRELAIKKIKGSLGIGFYKAEYLYDGTILLNNKPVDRNTFIQILKETEGGYVVTEYLHPHKDLAKFSENTANTIRYIACRVDGQLQYFKGYVRFGTKQSGAVENFNAGGVLCSLDQNGIFKEGYILSDIKKKSIKIIKTMPDTNIPLCGKIPHWDEIEFVVKKTDHLFPMLDYLGFDFVVTADEKVNILEINSLTSFEGLQIDGSVYDNAVGNSFFSGLLSRK